MVVFKAMIIVKGIDHSKGHNQVIVRVKVVVS